MWLALGGAGSTLREQTVNREVQKKGVFIMKDHSVSPAQLIINRAIFENIT